MTRQEMARQIPTAVSRAAWLYSWLRSGAIPDLTAANMPNGAGGAPAPFGRVCGDPQSRRKVVIIAGAGGLVTVL